MVLAFLALLNALCEHPFPFLGIPDIESLVFCILSTLLFARIAAKFANKAEPKVLNRVTGVILELIGSVILLVNII